MKNPLPNDIDWDRMPADLGGETLTRSGFETETPDSDFAEAASDESNGQ